MSAYQTKVCPRCGEELFSDMRVCYGCLYEFPPERSGAGTEENEGLAKGGEDPASQDSGLPGLRSRSGGMRGYRLRSRDGRTARSTFPPPLAGLLGLERSLVWVRIPRRIPSRLVTRSSAGFERRLWT